MRDHWEDRITREQHKKCSDAIDKFRKGKPSRKKEHVLYEVLCNNGVTSEEADEVVNLEVENFA
jgi:hypothetical protein